MDRERGYTDFHKLKAELSCGNNSTKLITMVSGQRQLSLTIANIQQLETAVTGEKYACLVPAFTYAT